MTAVLDWIGRIVRPSLRDSGPKSFMALVREHRAKSKVPTSKLYILHTDFEMSPDSYNNLQANLDVVREKYGIDFLILEPGFKLRRFDDY